MPAGGVWVSLPDADQVESVRAGDAAVDVRPQGLVRIQALPATLLIRYRHAPSGAGGPEPGTSK
jgi:hypothetical protein